MIGKDYLQQENIKAKTQKKKIKKKIKPRIKR